METAARLRRAAPSATNSGTIHLRRWQSAPFAAESGGGGGNGGDSYGIVGSGAMATPVAMAARHATNLGMCIPAIASIINGDGHTGVAAHGVFAQSVGGTGGNGGDAGASSRRSAAAAVKAAMAAMPCLQQPECDQRRLHHHRGQPCLRPVRAVGGRRRRRRGDVGIIGLGRVPPAASAQRQATNYAWHHPHLGEAPTAYSRNRWAAAAAMAATRAASCRSAKRAAAAVTRPGRVDNYGVVLTEGDFAHALAQSIGGGGGNGGRLGPGKPSAVTATRIPEPCL